MKRSWLRVGSLCLLFMLMSVLASCGLLGQIFGNDM